MLWFWRATRDIKLRFKGFDQKLDENTEETTKAVETAKQIETNIITNHGSQNLGDAVDRLTTTVWDIRDLARANNARVSELESKLDEHIVIAKGEGELLTKLAETLTRHLEDYKNRTHESDLMLEFGRMLMRRELGMEPKEKPDAE